MRTCAGLFPEKGDDKDKSSELYLLHDYNNIKTWPK